MGQEKYVCNPGKISLGFCLRTLQTTFKYSLVSIYLYFPYPDLSL